MKTIQDVLTLKLAITTELDELQRELKETENRMYFQFIKDGGNARSARDKVLDELKEGNTYIRNVEIGIQNLKAYKTYLIDSVNCFPYVDDIEAFITSMKKA